MPKKNNRLKSEARQRMAVTGETYMQARAALLAEKAEAAKNEPDLELGAPPVSAPLFQEPTP